MCVCVCVCACVCVCVCVCIKDRTEHVHVYIYIHTYIVVYIQVHGFLTNGPIFGKGYPAIRLAIRRELQESCYMCVCMYKQMIYLHMYTHRKTLSVYMQISARDAWSFVRSCVCVCVCVCVYTCTKHACAYFLSAYNTHDIYMIIMTYIQQS